MNTTYTHLCFLQTINSTQGKLLILILIVCFLHCSFTFPASASLSNSNFKQRSLSTADPAQSVISGISYFIAGTTTKILVTAKDSNGVLLISETDQFMVKISNRCNKQNDYYCSPSGASGPLSANINGMMTYTSNGVYTYDFQVPNSLGDISVQIYLLKSSLTYKQFYLNTSYSGSIAKNCTYPNLNFNGNNLCELSSTNYISGEFVAAVQFATSGIVKVNFNCDDYCDLFLDDNKQSFTYNAPDSVLSYNAEAGKYYTLYVKWIQYGGGYSFRMSAKNIFGTSVQIIYSLPVLINSSPYNSNIVAEICGDGFRIGSEQCDDSGTKSGDGCDSNCKVETGWICSGGSVDSKDACSEDCGDGIRFNSNSTYCDDGNTHNDDGCSSTCAIETGWTCKGGSLTSKDTCTEICGDGKRFNSNSTYCDDGNTASEDGCSSTCSIESGWICSGGSSSSRDACKEICGDGIKFNTISTYCDDGNTVSGDGCNSSCTVEPKWQCFGGDLSHKDECLESVIAATSTMSQAVSGASGSLSTVFSFCNVSAPTGLWITMNQFQLIMLLLLTKSSMPISIVSYLSGLKVTTCSFNFIPFRNIPGFDKMVNELDIRLQEKELRYFGIDSGSTFANNFSLICIVFILFTIHSFFIFIHRILKQKVKSKKKCAKCMEKTYQFFAFNLYIRVIFEANIFLLLSSFSELYAWNTSSFSSIISLLFAFIGGWICLSFVSLSLVNYSIHKDTNNMDKYIPLKEFFSGVSDKRLSRLYPTFLLLRRVIFVAWLTFGGSLNNFTLICLMIVIQVVYLANLILVRPYKQVRDNIIEITNELFYFVLVSLLSYFNAKDRWVSIVENAYFCIILGNSMGIISILIVAFSISFVIKLKKCCNKNTIYPKENQREESKISDLNLHNFTNFRVSNVARAPTTQREPQTDIAFGEESKQVIANPFNPTRTPTEAELYWQRYNHFDGGKLAKY